MERPKPIGGIIHTYQKYDPGKFPSPTAPPPDAVSPAFEHMLMYGRRRKFTEEELAKAIRLDPSQFAGLGPSLDALLAILKERKRKILAEYDPHPALVDAQENFRQQVKSIKPPKQHRPRFERAVEEEQIYDLERLWYAQDNERSPFSRGLVQLMEGLGEKYQVEELIAKYDFTGRMPLSVPQAIEVKEELEKIDELIKQLEEALETAQLAIIDLDELSEFVEPGDMEQLREMQKVIEEQLRQMAERQGLSREGGFFELTPKAYRVFQSKLLERIFADLQASRSGRHQGPIVGEGSVEMQQTKPYEFGDSISQMDIPQTLINAMLRSAEPNCRSDSSPKTSRFTAPATRPNVPPSW